MAGQPIPADNLTFSSRPFRWRMGLHELDPAQWLDIDEDRPDDLALKWELHRSRPGDVFGALPGSEAAGAEIETAVLEFLSARDIRPDPVDADHPLQRAGLMVQEDLLVMERREGSWYLTAGSLSFPTNWHLGEKLGQELDAIHAPVPRYHEDLGAAVPAFFDRLRVDRPVWRANWTITDDPGLRLERELRIRPNQSMTPEEAADRLHLRVERQTLRRFPTTDAVLFTVRILRQPVAWLARDPAVAAELAGALAELPADVAAYKDSTSRWAEPLIVWLRSLS